MSDYLQAVGAEAARTALAAGHDGEALDRPARARLRVLAEMAEDADPPDHEEGLGDPADPRTGESRRRVRQYMADHVRAGLARTQVGESLAVPEGFTGERKDKLGRRVCYSDGKRVPCPKAAPPAKPKPPSAADVHAEVAAMRSAGVTHAGLAALAAKMALMPARDLGALKAALGVRAAGPKAELAKKIAERALAPKAPTPAAVVDRVRALRAGTPTPADVAALVKDLGALTVKDLALVKHDLGVRAAGPKAELARKIAERALAKARPKPGPKARPKAPGPAPPAPTPPAAPPAAAPRLPPPHRDTVAVLDKVAETARSHKVSTLRTAREAILHSTGRLVDGHEIQAKLLEAYGKAEVTMNFKVGMKLPGGGTLADSLVAEPRLKNLFEVGTGGGSTHKPGRDGWERNNFGEGVGRLPKSERPKYGAINWKGGKAGAAPDYGSCVFVLNKDALKGRITCAPGNTSGTSARDVGSADNPTNGLARNPDALRAAGFAVGPLAPGLRHYSSYNEVQVWGEVPVNRDTIQAVRFPRDWHPGIDSHWDSRAAARAAWEAARDKAVEFFRREGIPVEYY